MDGCPARTRPGTLHMWRAQPSASSSSPAAQRAEGDATGWHGEVSWQGWKHATTLCLVWAMCF